MNETGKSVPNEVSQTPKTQIWHVFAYVWLLVVKSMTAKLQSLDPQSLGME